MSKSFVAPMSVAGARRRLVVPAVSAALCAALLAGCSSTPTRFQSRPSYGLGGSQDSTERTPSGSVYSNAPAAPSYPSARGDDPHPNAVYRGGRDPVTGKAPPAPSTWGGERSALPPPAAQPLQRADAGRAQPQRPQVAGRTVVEVAEGDSLYGLSTKYRVSMNSIMQANGLEEPTLVPGQKIVIPAR